MKYEVRQRREQTVFESWGEGIKWKVTKLLMQLNHLKAINSKKKIDIEETKSS